jgi:hypothetical protein
MVESKVVGLGCGNLPIFYFLFLFFIFNDEVHDED